MEQRSVFTLMTVLLQLNNLKKNSIHRCASSITMYRNILYHDTYRISRLSPVRSPTNK